MVYFVQDLTLRAWIFSVLPRLLRERTKIRCVGGRCYIIDGSRPAILAAKATARIARICVEKLSFRLVDMRDEAGTLIDGRLRFFDLFEVQKEALTEPVFNCVSAESSSDSRLVTFLSKGVSLQTRRKVLLVQIAAWKAKTMGSKGTVVLFADRQAWLRAVEKYASAYGVTIVGLGPRWELRTLVRGILGPKGVAVLRTLRDRFLYYWRFPLSWGYKRFPSNVLQSQSASTSRVIGIFDRTQLSTPRIAVEYHGHLNLNRPELYSDVFFWQQSSLSGSNVLITFGLPQDPLDEKKWAELKEHGMEAVARHPGATTIPSVPLFTHFPSLRRMRGGGFRLSVPRKSIEASWLREQMSNYQVLREYWADLFARYAIRVFISWYKSDGMHCAVADALESVGGVTAIYQRSFELPAAELAVDVDIVFSYSQRATEVNRLSGSRIRYHVVTGYLGDHRFGLLREQSRNVRSCLRHHGARYILAFFDENSHDDERWLLGHTITRGNYTFLLEKVLSNPWLGLVLKPKAPSTLRRRLGPVAKLLERATATGRCYVFEEGVLHGAHPPAAAALAADVAIHGHLYGGTAGLEAALAGVPTLLLDREGWHVSPLYQLGVGRVVFADWQDLWKRCVEHWTSPGGVLGFGDWSPMLDELDPFRDGRAAERMGIYLKWLIDGFKAGLNRETVMADAAERYCKLWGRDKVKEVRGEARWSYPAANHGGERCLPIVETSASERELSNRFR